MKKRIFLGMLSLVCIIGCMAACTSGTVPSSSTPATSDIASGSQQSKPEYYKCTYIGPLSGNSEQYGKKHQAALNFAIEKINADGGIDGVPIVIEYYDDKADAKETVAMANKVVADPEVLVNFGPYQSANCMAAAPIFEKAGISEVSPTCSQSDYVTQGEYMITGFNSMAYLQKQYAKFIYDNLGHTCALLMINDAGGNNTVELFPGEFEALGGTITAIEMPDRGTVDFTPMISKIKESNPEAVHVLGTYSEIAQIMIQARQLEFNVPFFCSDNIMLEDFIKVGGDAVEGFYMLTDTNPDLPSESFQALRKEYMEKVGSDIDPQTAHCIDQMNMFAEALRLYGPDRAKINSFLRDAKDYEGIAGTYSVVGGQPEKPMTAIVIKDGKFTNFTGK